jgi:hypothetical protein
MVITFEPAVLADPARYAEAAILPAQSLEHALRRRERALAGLTRLRAGGEAALVAFHAAAGRIVESYVAEWRARLPVDDTRAQLDALEAGDVSHLGEAEVHTVGTEARFGCCGLLGTYVLG